MSAAQSTASSAQGPEKYDINPIAGRDIPAPAGEQDF
jgi:hypothetical protein